MSNTFEKMTDIIHVESGWPKTILTPDRSYASLDLDSLSLMTIFVNLEDEFGVKFAEEAPYLPETTLNDLANFIDEKVGK